MRFGRKTIVVCCIAVLSLALACVWFAGSFLSKPVNHPVGALPNGLIGRSVEFASASGATIRGWLIPGRKGAGAIALMHGYRGDRTQVVGRAPFLSQAGYTVLAFDFQAHGESTGTYITAGYLESHDARGAIEFMKKNNPGEKIGVIGLSMGGVASVLASPPLDVDAMVLELVYPDIRGATANRLERYLGSWARPLAPLLTLQFPLRAGIDANALRPIDHIGLIHSPKLFIAGAKDQHTKLAESKALFDAASEPKELWVVDAAHVNIHEAAKDEYERRALRFFRQSLRTLSTPITKEEAIQIAEEFIADNGYTDLPPVEDRLKLAFETLEWESDVEEMLKSRRDSLARKAFGTVRGKWNDPPGWTVVFRYKRGDDIRGRAVTMGSKGENIRVEHQDFLLMYAERLPSP